MARGLVDWVIVGADRITAQGDTKNKIGTYNLAVLAKYHNVRFMVVAHSSTIDFRLQDGSDIPIEERPATEVTELAGRHRAAWYAGNESDSRCDAARINLCVGHRAWCH